jgi:hypothetical protein
MATVTPARTGDRKLQLKEVLDWLIEDGMVEPAVAAKIITEARNAARPTPADRSRAPCSPSG